MKCFSLLVYMFIIQSYSTKGHTVFFEKWWFSQSLLFILFSSSDLELKVVESTFFFAALSLLAASGLSGDKMFSLYLVTHGSLR